MRREELKAAGGGKEDRRKKKEERQRKKSSRFLHTDFVLGPSFSAQPGHLLLCLSFTSCLRWALNQPEVKAYGLFRSFLTVHTALDTCVTFSSPSTHGNFSKTLIPPKCHYPTFLPSLFVCHLLLALLFISCSFISQSLEGPPSGIALLPQENSKTRETKETPFVSPLCVKQTVKTNTIPWEWDLLCSFQNQVPPSEMLGCTGEKVVKPT